ncbi:MAG: hypothetical protein IT428_29740 [Planctomycetaceae bacterium]|nr:hypothetical protein [Planctomycetaceae bacterium]
MTVAYRYQFEPEVPLDDVEAALVLALFAVESLRGPAEARLDVRHLLDVEKRVLVIDAETPAGRDLAKVFIGFLRRETAENGFTVRQIDKTTPTAA